MRSIRRLVVGTFALVAVFAGSSATASAAVTAGATGSELIIDGTAETTGLSDIDVYYVAASGNFFVDTSRPLSTTSPCVPADPSSALCPSAGITLLTVRGGNASEFIRLEAPTSDPFPSTIAYRAYGGGSGDNMNSPTVKNKMNGGKGDDVVNGDSGRDNLNGGGGTDFVSGFAGNDKLEGGKGRNDTLNGGDNVDTLDAQDGLADAAIDCGPGADNPAVIDIGIDPTPSSC